MPMVILSPDSLVTRDTLRAYLVQNDTGYHIRNYRPSSPVLSTFVAQVNGLEVLSLSGCARKPRLRFCDGCHDFFLTNFGKTVFPNLRTLEISCIYMSGGRLHRFIKYHAATLEEEDLIYHTFRWFMALNIPRSFEMLEA